MNGKIKHWKLWVIALVGVTLGPLAIHCLRPEPVYQGKTATEWLKVYRPGRQEIAPTGFGGYDYSNAETNFFWLSSTKNKATNEYEGWLRGDGGLWLGTNRESARVVFRIGERPWPYPYNMVARRQWLEVQPELRFLRDPAYLALWQMGPAAVPRLISALEHQETSLDRLYRRFWGACPPAFRSNYLTAPFSAVQLRSSASAMLGQMGDIALPAVPALTRAVNDRYPDIRRNSVRALGQLRIRDPEVVNTLIGALSDPDREVQERAVDALASLGPDARPAIPTLEKLLLKPGTNWDLEVFVALDRLVTDAAPQRPVITELLRNWGGFTNPTPNLLTLIIERKLNGQFSLLTLGQIATNTPSSVLWHLQKLGPEAAPVVPEMRSLLDSTNLISRVLATRILGAIGPAARTAVPQLEKMQLSATGQLAVAISNALVTIGSGQHPP